MVQLMIRIVQSIIANQLMFSNPSDWKFWIQVLLPTFFVFQSMTDLSKPAITNEFFISQSYD